MPLRADSTKSGRSSLNGTAGRRAILVGCVVLFASQLLEEGLTFDSARCYQSIGAEPVVLADAPATLGFQEPKGAFKMNHNSASVRVFKVTGARVVNSTILIEDVERGGFKDLGGCGIDDTFLAKVSGTPTVDKYTFCALDALRKQGLSANEAELPQQMPRSIDEAVDQAADKAEARMRERIEFQERWRREHPIDESGGSKLPRVHKEPRSAVGESSGQPVVITVSEPSPEEQGRIEEQAKQHIREVWSYGRGKRLEWKRMGRTPAGRDYDVLTVDGAELLYPASTSIQIAPPKNK